MKVDLERFLGELEVLVNIDNGQGNPEGITEEPDRLPELIIGEQDLPIRSLVGEINNAKYWR